MDVDHYAKFVDEAFIDPIRSVLIVDDDYPTFEEMLSDGESLGKDWRNQTDRVRKIIRGFRARNLLVDIHDGRNVGLDDEIREAEHLHQSDLLVLDYQLDKTRAGDGSIAINIIRKLMANTHFNLVVVHTSENLDAVFQNVILALLPYELYELTQDDLFLVDEALEELRSRIGDLDSRLDSCLGPTQYLKYRQVGFKDFIALFMKKSAIFNEYSALCEEAEWNLKTQKLILRYQLSRAAEAAKKGEGVPTPRQIDWSDGDVKWARSDTVFVAFSSKRVGEEPLQELSAALHAWRPDPSRLYLARLQHEIDEHGTALQAQVLGKKHALAGWYHGMLIADPDATKSIIKETITRHSEQLINSVVPNVADFAERLVEAERAGDAHDICQAHFDVDLNNKEQLLHARCQHNSVVSSQNPEGWHLTTGHIFRFSGHYWVCASPACDMVPSQLSAFRKEIYQSRIPFAAIRLQPVKSIELALNKASSSRILFLEINEEIKAFSFNDISDDMSSPHWSILFADKLGKLDPKSRSVSIIQVEGDDSQMLIKAHDAEIVSQLRYEYALNLVQRLGVSMSRIGLDFSGYKPPQ
ncbi:response regulator receiver domain [Methylobacterium oryzihabitans]|uniref:Response receiver domain-containing protein n=1 Tax=Methylobacterium oryzihabitans TaxID=2499852 RepID=A0A3S2V3B0_9HYPH|nr:response regulator receiver domain [Methylobacterium oryzihabitans]RVU13187.1 hypothetical protein EOE48_26820 [Methylobacterium oryzihabitans]